jgi:hypothetical protein
MDPVHGILISVDIQDLVAPRHVQTVQNGGNGGILDHKIEELAVKN